LQALEEQFLLDYLCKRLPIQHTRPHLAKVNRRPCGVLGAYLLDSLTLVAIGQFYLWGKTRILVHQPVAAEGPNTLHIGTKTWYLLIQLPLPGVEDKAKLFTKA
jgi:hypothetical protein